MKKNRNKLAAVLLCLCLCAGSTAYVQAAPQYGFVATQEGMRWLNADGTWAVNCWIEVEGIRYHVNEYGVLQTGLAVIDGQTYYFYETGAMAQGWVTLGSDVYFFNTDGMLQRNANINGCLVGNDGKLYKAVDADGRGQQAVIVQNILSSIIVPGMTEEQKLAACYNYVVNASSYKRTYETPAGDWTGTFALEILGTGQGNCYRYAAAYASLVKGLGYDARVATGVIGNRKGGLSPHGWTEVRIGGTWYIFDTEMQDATNGRKNYYFRTYADYPSRNLMKAVDWPVYL